MIAYMRQVELSVAPIITLWHVVKEDRNLRTASLGDIGKNKVEF
jgi:hypothetical protein